MPKCRSFFIIIFALLLSSCSGLIEAWTNLSGSVDSSSTAPANNAPVSSSISPASFNEDIQSVITLSYSDNENDKATSCSVSALSNVTVTQACSCDLAGVCTVGVTGTTDYNGAASFNFSVTDANGKISNVSSATLTINPVNDLAVVTLPANLVYPLDGTNEPMIQGTQYVFNFSAVDSKDNQSIVSLSCSIQSVGMHASDVNFRAPGTNCTTLESLTTTNSVLVKSTASLSTSPGMNATGSLTWIPTSLQRGTFQITITADDGVATSSNSFYVTIREPFDNGSSLVLALDASVAAANTTIGSTVSAIPRLDAGAFDDLSDWLGLKSAVNGLLSGGNFVSANPWSGVGSYANPYQLNFNGVNDVLSLGTVLNAATRVGFSMWVKPTNVNTANSVLLSNGGGTGNGVVLRQSRTGSGQLELELGNVAPNYSATVLADSPIAYWRLNEAVTTIADSSGANNCAGPCNGTASATYVQQVVGGLAKDTDTAITMGSDGVIDFGNNFNFGNAGTDNPFSVEFWVKRNSSDSGWVNWRYVFSKTDLGNAEYAVRFSDTLISLTLSSPNGADWIVASGYHNIFPGTWNHIIVTYNGNKSATGINFFINGRSVSTIQVAGGTYNGMTATATSARVGQLTLLPYDLDGTTIDELAVYNYALDATKARNHYLAGAGCRTETPMLNNQWHHVAGSWNGTNLRLFINGAQECDFAATGTLSPAATNLYFGATSTKTNPFAGAVADLKINAGSGAVTIPAPILYNADALATMNRFRSVPLEDIVKDKILLHWDAAYANMGTGPQTCGMDLGNRNIQWFDISPNANHGMINSGGGAVCGASAWAGAGSAADPHRFILNTPAVVNFEVPKFSNPSTTSSYEFWVKADKQPNGVHETYDGLMGTSNAGLNLYYFGNQLGEMGWYSGGVFTSFPTISAPTDTNWHQIVFVMDGGASRGYIYIDGTLRNPGGTPFTPSSVSVNTLGIARGNNGAYRLENPLSIVRIYDKALTQNEIRQNCHAQKNRFAGMTCAGP